MIRIVLAFAFLMNISFASDEVTCDSLVYQAILKDAGAFEGPNSYINYQVQFERPWAERAYLTYHVNFNYLDDDGFTGEINYIVRTRWNSRFGAVYMCRPDVQLGIDSSGWE